MPSTPDALMPARLAVDRAERALREATAALKPDGGAARAPRPSRLKRLRGLLSPKPPISDGPAAVTWETTRDLAFEQARQALLAARRDLALIGSDHRHAIADETASYEAG